MKFSRSFTFLALALVVVMTLALSAVAVGSATVTTTNIAGIGNANIVRYTIAWASNASGAVSGHAFTHAKGRLIEIKFVPGTVGDQPTNLYDITVVDTDGLDILAGAGANLSNATPSYVIPSAPFYLDGTFQIDLVVANAGDTKKGTVYLYIAQ